MIPAHPAIGRWYKCNIVLSDHTACEALIQDQSHWNMHVQNAHPERYHDMVCGGTLVFDVYVPNVDTAIFEIACDECYACWGSNLIEVVWP